MTPYDQLAVWIEARHPRLFAVLRDAAVTQKLGTVYAGNFAERRPLEGLGQYEDYFSDASDDISDDASDFDITGLGDTDSGGPLDLPSVTTDDSLEASIQNSGLPTNDEIAAQTVSAANPSVQTAITDQDLSATLATPTVNIPSDVATTPSVPVSSAASSVGSFLSSQNGASILLATLKGANQIVSSLAAANVIEAQAARAAAGYAPANIGYTTTTDPNTGQVTVVPVLNQNGSQIALGDNAVDSIAPPGFLQNYGVYLIVGAAALALLA
jgi:hypothetical protein